MTVTAAYASRYSFRRLLPIVIFVVGLAIGAVSTLLISKVADSTSGALGTLVAVPGAQVIASASGSGTQEIPVMNRSTMRFHRLGLDVTCIGDNEYLLVQVYIPGLAKPLGVMPKCTPNGGGMWEVALPRGTVSYPEKVMVRASSATRWSFMLVNSEKSVGVARIP